MFVVFALLGIGVIAVLAVLLSRPRQLLSDDSVPGRPFQPPAEPIGAAELAAARFPVAVRGYRMADVDAYVAAAIAALAQAESAQAESAQAESAQAESAAQVQAQAIEPVAQEVGAADARPEAHAMQPPPVVGPGN